MTETNNSLPNPENNDTPQETTSPWVMIISMLLLISGLLLSSAMLIHHATNGENSSAKKPFFDFTNLMKKGMALSAKEKQPEQTETVKKEPAQPTASAVKKLLSSRNGGAVRWPKLKLTGFGAPTNSNTGFAIINGKHIIVGGTVNGATLTEILDHGVRVEYKGESKTLIVEITH